MTRACRSRGRISNIFSLCSILGMPLDLGKDSFYLVTSASKKKQNASNCHLCVLNSGVNVSGSGRNIVYIYLDAFVS
jgi:hypothetical protein